MGENERAMELLNQAENALNRFSFFGLLNSQKYEDAIECYTKAANTFKMIQNFSMAGKTFEKIADLEIKANSSHFEASQNLINAAQMYSKSPEDKKDAVRCFEAGIRILIDQGRFGIAAKHSESIAEMLEKDNDLLDAIKYYQQSASFYNSDNSPSRANKNLEKIGILQGSDTVQDYKSAFDAFDKLGKSSLDSNLLKFNAKKHFFHALLCLFARNDLVAVDNAVQLYKSLDYTFEESRECKLIESISEAVKCLDSDKFSDVLYSYDQVSKLSPWETSLLLKVKNMLQESGEEMPDLR